jgi:integrase
LRLLGLTLLRRSELAGGRWDEVDMGARLWVVPRDRMKANREHVVPLSNAALAVLRKLRTLAVGADSAFILPSAVSAEAHMDPRALTRAMARTLTAFKLDDGSPHDLRRTAATWLTANGVRRFTVSWLLAHSAHEGAAITSVYDRNEYLQERAAALELWGMHLESMRPPDSTRANILAFTGGFHR